MGNQDKEYFNPLWDDFDGELFQDLVCDLLSAEGYQVEPSGVGPDGGIDAFAQQLISFGYNNPESFTWAVQCKYRSQLKKSISPSEVGPIHNIVNNERFQTKDIKGFFLATNGRLSTNMMSELRGLNISALGLKTTFWDRSRIHDVLERHFSVYKKYFPRPPDETDETDETEEPEGPSPGRPPTLPSTLTVAVLEEFQRLINSPRTREVEIHAFLEAHPNFLALGEYGVEVYSEVAIESPEGAILRPDFLVQPASGLFFDVIEVKRPAAKIVIKRQGVTYLAAQLKEAIIQLKYYREAFEQPSFLESFANDYGLRLNRPRLVLLIGRSTDFDGEIERMQIQSQLPEVSIVTYDDLLEHSRRRLEQGKGT